jgi:hypothetical protein
MAFVSQPFEPVKISTADVLEEERETLFCIDVDEYTIPKRIRPNMVILYLQDTYEKGQEFALAAAMPEVLGADAMEALADCDAVTDEQMQQVMDIVERKLMAQMKKSLGNSRRGRSR